MKILTITNNKGGVAKTTSVQNIGAALEKLGYKVLLVDLDPQGNLSSSFGINTDKITLAEAIFDQISDFVSDKVKEISPEVDPQIRISKDYEYQKEATDETW